MLILNKLRAANTALPAKVSGKDILLAGIGGFMAIGVLVMATNEINQLMILGSFGASCVLVFGFPAAPFSQPRNVIAGHLLSSAVGLLALNFLGETWWSVALAVAVAIMLMMATRTVHPPAGSNPVIVFLTAPGWDFLLWPTLTGAVVLVLIALIYNNLGKDKQYPKYW